ncbi:hypothetical protein A1507_04700 [Methylomonas koyamae]|uniref:Transposase n=1 Tax=Methylomonas koyamae TaxID=702114 RepID=A0A177NRQ6_9GAMM|nr:hypothetical protein A1507_04700 [Methylomonas koyamae]
MRGHDAIQESRFSYVSLEERIPKQHPLRRLRLLVDGVLASMDAVFAELYAHTGGHRLPLKNCCAPCCCKCCTPFVANGS